MNGCSNRITQHHERLTRWELSERIGNHGDNSSEQLKLSQRKGFSQQNTFIVNASFDSLILACPSRQHHLFLEFSNNEEVFSGYAATLQRVPHHVCGIRNGIYKRFSYLGKWNCM